MFVGGSVFFCRGPGVPGFLAGLALAVVVFFHDQAFTCFRQNGHRPNLRIQMNKQDQVHEPTAC